MKFRFISLSVLGAAVLGYAGGGICLVAFAALLNEKLKEVSP